MKNLSIIIPSYNNLRHLKNCYYSLRRWYPQCELIIIDDASNDGTWEWLKEKREEDSYLINERVDERLGHTILYDVGIDMATNEIVGILHADMLVTGNTFENMMKNLDHINKGVVVCATRVEPPLHPMGDEKITRDFGIDFDSLDIPAFEQFAQRMEKEYKDETTNGMFAPWMIYKEDFQSMGGHDHIFAPFPYEDSDIFQRWILEGYELIQSRDSFVYHLTCRGHRWNEKLGENDAEYEGFEEKARRNYIRKWGSWIANDNNQYPIIFPKYDIGFVIRNCTPEVFNLVEPWCSTVYLTDLSVVDNLLGESTEIEKEIIKKKIDSTTTARHNDVIIEFDGKEFTQDAYNNFITKVNLIVDNNGVGEYEFDIFNIKINKKEPFGKEHFKPIYKFDFN